MHNGHDWVDLSNIRNFNGTISCSEHYPKHGTILDVLLRMDHFRQWYFFIWDFRISMQLWRCGAFCNNVTIHFCFWWRNCLNQCYRLYWNESLDHRLTALFHNLMVLFSCIYLDAIDAKSASFCPQHILQYRCCYSHFDHYRCIKCLHWRISPHFLLWQESVCCCLRSMFSKCYWNYLPDNCALEWEIWSNQLASVYQSCLCVYGWHLYLPWIMGCSRNYRYQYHFWAEHMDDLQTITEKWWNKVRNQDL